MPVTFSTKSYADITMLNEVAESMLSMMNYGNTVPGAIIAEDVEKALLNLQACIDKEIPVIEPAVIDDEKEPAITMGTRAVPLLELLQSALTDGHNVSWR